MKEPKTKDQNPKYIELSSKDSSIINDLSSIDSLSSIINYPSSIKSSSSINFGSVQIDFIVNYANRKTLGITVKPNNQIIVKAPNGVSIEQIKEKVRKRSPWILKQKDFFLSFHPKTPERRYVSGESHLYLGRQYRLTVTEGPKNSVRYKGRFIEVVTKDKEKAGVLLKQWYREKAKAMFAELAEPLILRFEKYSVKPTGIFIQAMPTRWGSCTPKGKIILNPELILAPKPCIEYVILHELCHLVYPNHSQKFIDLQTKEMPDWRKWKEKLERLLA
jgi:predicted metal-dependent hydrolase